MPKVYGTRKLRARELLKRLKEGPCFGHWNYNEQRDPSKTEKEHYQLWANSWIISEVEDLIPELAKLKKEAAAKKQYDGDGDHY